MGLYNRSESWEVDKFYYIWFRHEKQTKPVTDLTYMGRRIRDKNICTAAVRDWSSGPWRSHWGLGAVVGNWETEETHTTGHKVTGPYNTESQRCPQSHSPKWYSHLTPLSRKLFLLPKCSSLLLPCLFILWNPPQLSTAPSQQALHELLLSAVQWPCSCYSTSRWPWVTMGTSSFRLSVNPVRVSYLFLNPYLAYLVA